MATTVPKAPKMENKETNSLKVYVAGKWGDRERILKRIREVEAMGYEITYVWPLDEHASFENAARNEINAVKRCDIFIAIMDDPDYSYRGTFTELGCALGLGKTVFVVSPPLPTYGMGESETYQCASNCFYKHPSIIHFDHWSRALERLETYETMSYAELRPYLVRGCHTQGVSCGDASLTVEQSLHPLAFNDTRHVQGPIEASVWKKKNAEQMGYDMVKNHCIASAWFDASAWKHTIREVGDYLCRTIAARPGHELTLIIKAYDARFDLETFAPSAPSPVEFVEL